MYADVHGTGDSYVEFFFHPDVHDTTLFPSNFCLPLTFFLREGAKGGTKIRFIEF